MREGVTPRVIERVAWAGANIGSYASSAEAMKRLAGIDITTKQVRRITTDVGSVAVDERERLVSEHMAKPLTERLKPRSDVDAPDLGVVMMDGGRLQRRDHFGQPREGTERTTTERTTHWKEDKVGLCLTMVSEEHDHDPCPEFPDWLAGAEVVAEIARLGQPETLENKSESVVDDAPPESTSKPWPGSPELITRDVIASCAGGESFGHHLARKAWSSGVTAAERQAFVADGASVNWTIHRQHFSRMTGVLDLMHALSYAYRAAEEAARLADVGLKTKGHSRCRQMLYARWAEAIWQGRVEEVISELETIAEAVTSSGEPDSGPEDSGLEDSDPEDSGPSSIERAMTYYGNHRERMRYPEYRKRGLPLTSSLMESAIKQINMRVKGSEKFWCADSAEAVLQLRADSLSDSEPLDRFWPRWHARQDGSNRYRQTAA